MRYPTLTYSKTDDLVTSGLAGDVPSIASSVSWIGAGDEIDLTPLDRVVDHLRQRYIKFIASGDGLRPEVFEGRAAGDLHTALRDLPTEVLDDPGFWRFVSLAKFWWFIVDREEVPIGRGNHMTYVDGTRPAECVPLRMFLRAQSVRDGDDYSLASSMDNATDFWRSHVIRVQTGTAPPLARSFASLQARVRMSSTPELRPFARRVNRLWSNVVMSRLAEDEAADVIQELYDTRPASEPDGDVAS